MKVLIACEYSGIVRDAFAALGHDAMSCDLLPTERPGNHFQGDVLDVLSDGWDLMICHPPCTHLAVSGSRWFSKKRQEQAEALAFVQTLLDAPIKFIALENPVSIISSKIRKPNQIIQPWQFGHGETKATCLWLKGLPNLIPTKIVEGREQRVWKMPPSPDRWKERSRTFPGIAEAMANQWSEFLTQKKHMKCPIAKTIRRTMKDATKINEFGADPEFNAQNLRGIGGRFQLDGHDPEGNEIWRPADWTIIDD